MERGVDGEGRERRGEESERGLRLERRERRGEGEEMEKGGR